MTEKLFSIQKKNKKTEAELTANILTEDQNTQKASIVVMLMHLNFLTCKKKEEKKPAQS